MLSVVRSVHGLTSERLEPPTDRRARQGIEHGGGGVDSPRDDLQDMHVHVAVVGYGGPHDTVIAEGPS